jgi:hypothetical protein
MSDLLIESSLVLLVQYRLILTILLPMVFFYMCKFIQLARFSLQEYIVIRDRFFYSVHLVSFVTTSILRI